MLEQRLMRDGNYGLTAIVEMADKEPRLEQCVEQFACRRAGERGKRRDATHGSRVILDAQAH